MMVRTLLPCFLYTLGSITLAFADGPVLPAGSGATTSASSATAGAPPQPSFGSMAFPFLAMFAVVYFLMIRPQQKKVKEQQSMLGSLKHGDEVVTTSGILGKVTGISDKVITLEIASDVKVKMMKSQVAHVMKDGSVKDLTLN